MLHKMWHQKWKWPAVSLEYHTPEAFTRIYWQKSEKVEILFLLYRILLSIYLIITWVLSRINYGRSSVNKYSIYLTNWCYSLLVIENLIHTGMLIHKFVIERRKNNVQTTPQVSKVPILYKIYWIMFSISTPTSIVITVVFWAFVYNPELSPFDVINISTHIMNTVIALINILIVAHPYTMTNFLWVILYIFVYGLFTIFYHLGGGTDAFNRPFIYEILDWHHPYKALLTCVIIVVFSFIVHLFLCALQFLKECTREKLWKARAAQYVTGQDNLALEKKSMDIATIVV